MTQPRRPAEGATVAVLVPLSRLREHGEPVVVRRACRPRRVEKAPTIDEQVYLDAVADAVERGIEQDDVVMAASAGDPKALIERTMIAVAQEAAALLWDRQKAQRAGKAEADMISSRRVSALCRLADLVLVREQLRAENHEPEPEHLQRAIDMIMAEVEATVVEVAPPETAEMFLGVLKKKTSAPGLPWSKP